MKKLSIKFKLILLVGLGLVFVCTVVAIETISNARIKIANDQNFAAIEQANSDYREKTLDAQKRLGQVQDVLSHLNLARIAEKSYLQFYVVEYTSQLNKQVNQAMGVLENIEKNKATETLAGILQNYRQDFSKVVTLHERIEGLNEAIIGDFKALKELLAKAEEKINANRFEMQMQGEQLSPMESHFEAMVAQSFRTVDFMASMRSQYLLTGDAAYIETLIEHFETKMKGETASIRQTAKGLKNKIYTEAAQKYQEIVYSSYDKTLETRDLFTLEKKTSDQLNKYGTILTSTGESYLKDIADQMEAEQAASVAMLLKAKETRVASLAQVRNTVFWILVLAIGAGATISIVMAIFIIRSITGPVNTVIAGLGKSAADVDAASTEMSTASQRLAEGASEQAATIEETSSSLEELASMTKQNADNASQADGLMQEANGVVAQANDSMGQLTVSMQEISKASEDTSKIIKTIDEIAFQTNLLALNAAVEAARAGEAGSGFAVVADEVRNLAMRAADAARETANLIEGTVKKVEQGGDLVTSTNEAFARVADSASKVGAIVGEISVASNEQSRGIEQLNQAVAEMDKVVQQNAASAEESASSSVEMSDQAGHMNRYVADLVTIATGTRHTKKKKSKAQVEQATQIQKTGFETSAPKSIKRVQESDLDKLIPMDDNF